jgi:hypothetical protein
MPGEGATQRPQPLAATSRGGEPAVSVLESVQTD